MSAAHEAYLDRLAAAQLRRFARVYEVLFGASGELFLRAADRLEHHAAPRPQRCGASLCNPVGDCIACGAAQGEACRREFAERMAGARP